MGVKLAVFDVDGTLLRGDTACLWIAHRIGRYEGMWELEQADTRDKVTAALLEMAGWYVTVGKERLLDHLERFPWAPGTLAGCRLLAKSGVEIALASMGWRFVVEEVARRIGATHVLGTRLDFRTGEVDIVWGEHKADFVEGLIRDRSLFREQVAAIGDTEGDFPMLERVGLPIYVGPQLPPGRDYLHLPGADIREVASAILD